MLVRLALDVSISRYCQGLVDLVMRSTDVVSEIMMGLLVEPVEQINGPNCSTTARDDHPSIAPMPQDEGKLLH